MPNTSYIMYNIMNNSNLPTIGSSLMNAPNNVAIKGNINKNLSNNGKVDAEKNQNNINSNKTLFGIVFDGNKHLANSDIFPHSNLNSIATNSKNVVKPPFINTPNNVETPKINRNNLNFSSSSQILIW